MPARRRPSTPHEDYRHRTSTRRNNPPAGLAPTYEVRTRQTTRYAYDPHLDPQLVWAGKTFEFHRPTGIGSTTPVECGTGSGGST